MDHGPVGHNRAVKTVVVAVLGGLLTLSGVALLVLPGPGFVLVAAGLAVLGTRFSWAKKPLDYAKEKAQEGVEEVGKSPWRAAGAVLAALVLVALGVLALVGVDLPLMNSITAVVLIISGLFLIGTVVFARRLEKIEQARARRPAGVPGTGGAYRAAAPSGS
ncbi:PGPGW domain-containing protein [Modestobacter sp. I12A-02662]|uniref:PGPGW domain-containing protein n=1 Tax=Modestobacter sp. I12A-02662 TaxID=1730496 RepID=UPI0034DFC75F